LRSCWAWVPLDGVEFARGTDGALPVADEAVAGALAGGGVAPPPRKENTWPSTAVKPPEEDWPEPDPPPPAEPDPGLELDDLAAPAEALALLVLALEDGIEVETSRAPGVLAGSLHALVLGPACPGGAPPGSGTQPLGLDGSVSLIPGWLGPSQA
jgi:hypothetical protein